MLGCLVAPPETAPALVQSRARSRVHVLNPHRVDGPVKQQPLAVGPRVRRGVPERLGEHAVGPLVAGGVELAVQPPRRQRLGVEAPHLRTGERRGPPHIPVKPSSAQGLPPATLFAVGIKSKRWRAAAGTSAGASMRTWTRRSPIRPCACRSPSAAARTLAQMRGIDCVETSAEGTRVPSGVQHRWCQRYGWRVCAQLSRVLTCRDRFWHRSSAPPASGRDAPVQGHLRGCKGPVKRACSTYGTGLLGKSSCQVVRSLRPPLLLL